LRRCVASPVELLQRDDILHFLRVVFSRAVVASTAVEKEFATLTRWTRKGLSMPALAAKHVLRSFEDIVRDWRKLEGCRRQASRRRPRWVRSIHKGGKVTGLHLFTSRFRKERPAAQMREVWQAWTELPDDEKSQWRENAAGARTQKHSAHQQ